MTKYENGANIVFNKWCWTTEHPHAENIYHSSFTLHQNWIKMDHRSKSKIHHYKFLEDNPEENLNHAVYGDDFLDTHRSHDPWKKKIDILDFIIVKNIYYFKNKVRIRRWVTDLWNICEFLWQMRIKASEIPLHTN